MPPTRPPGPGGSPPGRRTPASRSPLHLNVEYHYGAALTIGASLFVSATAGALADAASTGGTTQVARVISATRIRFKGDL
jgi:hypothetical protein